MNVKELARALNQPSELIFEMVLNSLDTENIQDDLQPLGDTKIIQKIARNLDWHVRFGPDPKKVRNAEAKTDKNLDILYAFQVLKTKT